MVVLVIGLLTAFNFIIILLKFKAGRIEDAVLDVLILSIIMYLTSGSLTGMQVGMVGSSVVSFYLLLSRKSLFRRIFS